MEIVPLELLDPQLTPEQHMACAEIAGKCSAYPCSRFRVNGFPGPGISGGEHGTLPSMRRLREGIEIHLYPKERLELEIFPDGHIEVSAAIKEDLNA